MVVSGVNQLSPGMPPPQSASGVGASRTATARPHEEQKRTFSEHTAPHAEQVTIGRIVSHRETSERSLILEYAGLSQSILGTGLRLIDPSSQLVDSRQSASEWVVSEYVVIPRQSEASPTFSLVPAFNGRRVSALPIRCGNLLPSGQCISCSHSDRRTGSHFPHS